MQSRFIVLEGPDGAGTTLHTRLLAESLRLLSVDVVLTKEPTDGTIGQTIRQELGKGTMPAAALQMLFCADRAWHNAAVIEPALSSGKTVISDRYALSTIVYGTALGLDTLWLYELNKKFIQPDCQILLLPSFETSNQRVSKRPVKDMLETNELQRSVYDAYVDYSKKHPEFICVDTAGGKEEVAKMILEIIVGA